MSLELGIGLLMAVIVVCHTIAIQMSKAKGSLPMWPLVGMLPSVLYHLQDIYDWITEVQSACGGTFTFKGPWLSRSLSEVVVTAQPANVEYALKTRFSNFPKGGTFRSAFEDLLGDGIFNADDESWKTQRKMSVVHMQTPAVRNHMAKSVEKLVGSRLLPLLENASRKGSAIDLQDVLLRFTFDNICIAGLGVDLGCLSVEFPEVPFARAFEQATEATAFRFTMPPYVWKTMKHFGIGTEGRLKRALKTINEFAAGVVARKREELIIDAASLPPHPHQTAPPSRLDLLSVLMQGRQAAYCDNNNECGSLYSDKFLRDFCINLILAGRDTSSVALSWFFWLLLDHPHVEEKILSEINSILKRRKEGEGYSRPSIGGISVEAVKQMHYLHAALSESLRLYPSVPLDFKEAVEEDVLPDGTRVKKGAWLLYSIYSMGRLETIWGEDCREFKPERWIREGVFVSESAYKYPAFNGGPRLCLGKDFALCQMKSVAASILSEYRLTMAPGHVVAPKLATTLYMKNGLQVILHARPLAEIESQNLFDDRKR